MNTVKQITICLLVTLLISSCTKEEKKTIVIKNTLNIERSLETVELSKRFLNVTDLTHVSIRDAISGEIQITQTVDNDGDGSFDEILFQPTLAPNSEKSFEIIIDSISKKPKAEAICYSRFVPERTDDYTWENNKVAFRVYGPTAQKMIEDNIPGGTLSSGVDAWLKKVEYPIINKWYKEFVDGTGSYHEDTGEGLDNFHVGVSRGVGGIAIKVDTTYYYSKNYVTYRTITTGPIRTSFYLEYENWDAGGKTISESKIISLDYGSNFSKFETSISGSQTISAGLTLHEKDGIVKNNKKNGWVSYWQPHAESEIGTAIIADSNTFINSEEYNVNTKDLSNAYAQLKITNKKVVYYAGFGWKESGNFNNQTEWETYLSQFSQKLKAPLQVTLTNK